ncbi:radical SAM protein [Mesorhizobium sp.]|uniref:radical SAM protein n=1 Tax=Mesorhizobium sp. TaxID=1871066 RepID=UPI0025BDAE5B|nr:radical SAM protein [Mesorhizobium sp.]
MVKLRMAGKNLPAVLRDVVDYRKSGLSLNHVVGCPLDCGYCVRHLFDNYDMKKPHLVMSDHDAIETLVTHWAFRADTTPLQIFNRATDPFLPGVKDHLFACLEALDARGLSNPVLVITRWHIARDDVARLERLSNLRVTVLITWSGIDDQRIEPVDSAIAERSLATLANHRTRTKSILYWRPLIAGINDTDRHLHRASELAEMADATAFTGLFYREQIRAHFEAAGVPEMYDTIARRKILPRELELKLIASFGVRPLFRKTSCAVAFAHGTADYNGHFGIREVCDICPASQVAVCARHHVRPNPEAVATLAASVGLDTSDIRISERNIEVLGSQEQQRYFMQHALNYQVHDRAQPHHHGRHGRAEVGWE